MNHISKILKSTTVIGALAFVTAITTQASPVLTLTDPGLNYGGTPGGEFTVTPSNGDTTLINIANNYYDAKAKVGSGFETFCMQTHQGLGGTQFTYSITNGTLAVADPLSVGSAWLYAAFSDGTLAGYNYTPGAARRTSADNLQQAFWWLEDEFVIGSNTTLVAFDINNPFMKAVVDKFGLAGAKADNVNGAVKVLNLFGTNGSDAQDQLVRVPDGGLTVALVGFAVLGLAFIRRKIAA